MGGDITRLFGPKLSLKLFNKQNTRMEIIKHTGPHKGNQPVIVAVIFLPE